MQGNVLLKACQKILSQGSFYWQAKYKTYTMQIFIFTGRKRYVGYINM